MKKRYFIFITALVMATLLQGCGTKNESADASFPSASRNTGVSEGGITEETVYEGVYNYCRSTYDWSIAESNPEMMYLQTGEETESEYQVIFRSYTGTFVYFYVDKASGATRLTEYVPALDLEEEAGTINLYDYLEQPGTES